MFREELHPYQIEPVDIFLDRKSLLVAYEMGLGKTVIAIAAAEKLLDSGAIGCCLVVCPASLKYQWAERIRQFTDVKSFECQVIDGDPKKRALQYEGALTTRPHYIVMGYDNVINDHEQVARIKPGMTVLDEATAIKTFRAKRTKRIKKLLRSPYRLALTGTPIENRPDEIFSIMQWVDETVLGRYDLFDRAYITRNRYGWPVSYKNLPVLKQRLGTAMCRKSRLSPEVYPYLPEVDEDEWYIGTDTETLKLYKYIAGDIVDELSKLERTGSFDLDKYYSGYDESTPSGKVMGMYMCIQMLMDHPDLIIYSGQLYEFGEAGKGSGYAYSLWQSGHIDSVTECPKLDYLIEKLDGLLAFPDSKIIIFSEYRNMLSIIASRLNCGYVKFHGGMDAKSKNKAYTVFRDDPECRVFLSSNAGAYGMDMSMANYLINYDIPWSAGQADQRNGRHVRASSEFSKVFIRNMIVKGSVEERKLRILSRKRRLASSVLDGAGHDDYGRIDLEGDSLGALLKKTLNPGGGLLTSSPRSGILE